MALVERQGRRLRLTDAGRGLVEHATAVIARLELAESELAAAAGDEVAGRVRLAAFQTAASGLVLPLLGALRERHPKLRVELLEMEAEEALDLLRRGEVDLVVAEEYDFAPRPRDPGLVLQGVCRDPLVLVLPEAHPLAAADPETVPLAALAGEAWATPRVRAPRSTTRWCARAARSAASSQTSATARTTSRCSSSSSRRARRSR